MIRVLICDDQAIARHGLQMILASAPDLKVVGQAQDGQEAVELTAQLAPDVVLMDLKMPRLNGVETLRRIRQSSRMPVIMLTARGDDVDRIVGLELGADDYVPKPCTPRELVARIRAILRRSGGEDAVAEEAGPVQSGLLTMWPERREARWQEAPLELTSTEFNLLELLARRAGHVVSKGELSESALGRPLARFDRSIDVHISSIRHKLGPRPDGQSWIQTVRGQGYQLVKV